MHDVKAVIFPKDGRCVNTPTAAPNAEFCSMQLAHVLTVEIDSCVSCDLQAVSLFAVHSPLIAYGCTVALCCIAF